jgi:anaerobic selenocysteine-containing dehydrogenase
VKPGTDVAVALAVHRYLFASGYADRAFLDEHTRGADRLRERAEAWTFERAAETAGIKATQLEQFAQLYASSNPALVRCGWGLERNRNGGNAAMAVLALPAVGGKFGVRGGGYAMSNSAAWSIDPTWIRDSEPETRLVNMNHLGKVLGRETSPPVKVLFVYNCNPAVTVPNQNLILEGLAREDLFTIVFDQVMTDTAAYADLVLPATTFLETYDIARAYGPISLQMVRPVIDAVGESRPNPEMFGQLITALGLDGDEEPRGELETLLQVLDELPGTIGDDLRNDRQPAPAFGLTPVQFVDVFPRTGDGKVDLFPAALNEQSAAGLYVYLDDRADDRYPLALISPASDRTVSSTLGELKRPEVGLVMHPLDAHARGLEEGASIRVFNELGEVHCPLSIEPTVRPGTVALPKGLWRSSTANRSTATALAPDTLSDVGQGACFNDARVQVERVVN